MLNRKIHREIRVAQFDKQRANNNFTLPNSRQKYFFHSASRALRNDFRGSSAGGARRRQLFFSPAANPFDMSASRRRIVDSGDS
jgi:hypothetical protein